MPSVTFQNLLSRGWIAGVARLEVERPVRKLTEKFVLGRGGGWGQSRSSGRVRLKTARCWELASWGHLSLVRGQGQKQWWGVGRQWEVSPVEDVDELSFRCQGRRGSWDTVALVWSARRS